MMGWAALNVFQWRHSHIELPSQHFLCVNAPWLCRLPLHRAVQMCRVSDGSYVDARLYSWEIRRQDIVSLRCLTRCQPTSARYGRDCCSVVIHCALSLALRLCPVCLQLHFVFIQFRILIAVLRFLTSKSPLCLKSLWDWNHDFAYQLSIFSSIFIKTLVCIDIGRKQRQTEAKWYEMWKISNSYCVWTRPTQNETLPRFGMTGWTDIVLVTGRIVTSCC